MDHNRGGTRRGSSQYYNHCPPRPSTLPQRNAFQQPQIPRMMNNMHQWPGNNYSHLASNLQGGSNFQPLPEVQRVVMSSSGFNETQSGMENYQNYYINSPEMVPSPPPTFAPPFNSQASPPVFVATNMAVTQHLFPPNSPNDPNINFVPGIHPQANPPNSSSTASALISYNLYSKLNQTVRCSTCGHLNHLAGSEISNLERELSRLKVENDELRNQLKVKEEVSIQMMPFHQQTVTPLIHQAVTAANIKSTPLSPNAKEFVLGESKEAKIVEEPDEMKNSEVPVVSVKGIVDEQPAGIPNEVDECHPVTDEINTLEPMNKDNISILEGKKKCSENSEAPSVEIKDNYEQEISLQSKSDEAQIICEENGEIAVEGVHTSCQTNEPDDVWDLPEENKAEPPADSGVNERPQLRQRDNFQHHYYNRGLHKDNNRGRVVERRGRGRYSGRNDGMNNDSRYQNNQQRNDQGGQGYQRGSDTRSFKDRQYYHETNQSQSDCNRVSRPEGTHYRANNTNFPSGKEQGRTRGHSRDSSTHSTGRIWPSNIQNNQQPAENVVRDGESSASGKDLLTEAKSQGSHINEKKSYLKKNIVVDEIKGDLFSAEESYSLAHCVAKDFKMGKGIAVLFRDKFKRVGELLDQNVDVGGCAYLKEEKNNRYIFYLVTKARSNWKPNMTSLTQSLQAMKTYCEDFGVTKLAMPRIGCGLDQLKWGLVRQTINEMFQHSNIHILVYDFNVEGEPEGKADTKYDGIQIKYEIRHLSTMEAKTGLLFFGTEDGYMDSTAVNLNERFKFQNDYKKASKNVGKVWCFKKCPNEQYYIYSLIVAKTKGQVSFVNIESCCKDLAKLLRVDQWSYMAIEALIEWSGEDTLYTEKVVNLLRYSLPRKYVSELWVCFQQSGHDKLMVCSENNMKKKSPEHKVSSLVNV